MRRHILALTISLLLAGAASATEYACTGSAYLSASATQSVSSDLPTADGRSEQERRMGLPARGETNGIGSGVAQVRCEAGALTLFGEALGTKISNGSDEFATVPDGISQAWAKWISVPTW